MLVSAACGAAGVEGPLTARAGEMNSRGTAISSTIFFDANANGSQEADEPGVSGVKLILWSLSADGSPKTAIEETTTAWDGSFYFHAPGDNYVVQMAPENFEAGAPLERHLTVDESALNRGAALAASFAALQRAGSSLASGNTTISSHPALEFGARPLGFYRQDLGGTIWQDANRNGRRDADEPASAGAVMSLYDGQNNLVLTTTTDLAGNYLFTRVPSGTYSIQAVLSKQDLELNFETTPVVSNEPDDNEDNDSNALPGLPGYGITRMFKAWPGDTGVQGQTHVRKANGSTSNQTIDMGFTLRTSSALGMRNLDAQTAGRRVTVQWFLGGGDLVAGFKVYRAAGERPATGVVPADAVAVTQQLVASFGDGNYGITDATAAARTTYSYFLAEYDFAGRVRVIGPVVATTGAATTYLPSVAH